MKTTPNKRTMASGTEMSLFNMDAVTISKITEGFSNIAVYARRK